MTPKARKSKTIRPNKAIQHIMVQAAHVSYYAVSAAKIQTINNSNVEYGQAICDIKKQIALMWRACNKELERLQK